MATTAGDNGTPFSSKRKWMVEHQLIKRGIADPAVIRAMEEVPREIFVPDKYQQYAYDDGPLPIEADQTISQPFIVAKMCEEIAPQRTDRVLEIGGGSGYAAAVLSRIVAEVYTIERHKVLTELAKERLQTLGYDNVTVLCGDGTLGWPEQAPFDGIIVSAGAHQVPPALKQQLAVDGHLVIPRGTSSKNQRLIRITRTAEDTFSEHDLGGVRFVPLISDSS